MKAIYVQKGETLDYTPDADVTAGSIVPLTSRIGIAAAPISAGETGTLQMEGVFRFPKASGEEIQMGAAVFYDAATSAITTAADGNTPAGYAAAPALAKDSGVLVKLLG